MKKLLLLLVVLSTFGCKKIVASFEQPTDMKLDNLKLEVLLDKEKVQEINFKAADGMPSYQTFDFSVSDGGKHQLQFKTRDTVFNYEISYPEEKYILVTTHLNSKGKIHVGIVKQAYKFRY